MVASSRTASCPDTPTRSASSTVACIVSVSSGTGVLNTWLIPLASSSLPALASGRNPRATARTAAVAASRSARSCSVPRLHVAGLRRAAWASRPISQAPMSSATNDMPSSCPRLPADGQHPALTRWSNFRSRLFVAIRVGLVTIRIVTLTISIGVYIIHGTNSCATLLLAFRRRERFKESRNTPQTIEELSNRQVDDVLQRLLACEKGGHPPLEALAVLSPATT